MIDACHACLRRAYLVALLAARIAALLDRPTRRPRGLLALPDERLIAAVGSDGDEEPRRCIEEFDSSAACEEIERAGCFATCRHREVYPAGLLDLVDPPPAIFGVGDPSAVRELGERPAVTIVGARAASPYGVQMARSLGRGLAVAGVPVVSGLALGIDAAAHEGCLKGEGRGVAVLAGGPDRPYPLTNRGLYERLTRSGAVVSELPPGRRAYRWSFPARNRIMAGFARMTVLVEAADPSGSLITAEFARDLGRTVGAVPGRATAAVSAGTNALIRDGAALITSAADVIDELYGAGVRPASGGPDGAPPAPRPPRADTESTPDLPEDPLLREVLAAVEAGHGVDGVARAAGIEAPAARAALGRLEADGYITRSGLGSYERGAAMA
jgi:DNA processing protein